MGGIPKDYRYYDYPATKTDANIYLKWMHELYDQLESICRRAVQKCKPRNGWF